MIKGVAFDMDGLMFDTERLAVKAWGFAGSQMGYLISEELVIKTIGLNIEDTRRVFRAHLGADCDFDALRQIRTDYATDYIGEFGIPLKTGLFELLNHLKSNHYKITVATSSDSKKAGYYLEKAGLAGFFDDIVCGDMIKRGKPEPDIYARAGEILGLSPDQCLALEDSPSGVLSAYSAGMKPVMIPDLIQPDEEIRKMLFAEVPTLLHVIELLNLQG